MAPVADFALTMVPADVNFTTAVGNGNHKAGEIQGQTRQHSRLINLLGVKQIAIGVNKMVSDTAGYKQARCDEIANEMKNLLVKVGWKKKSHREEHTSFANLRLNGRQYPEEVDEHGVVEGPGH